MRYTPKEWNALSMAEQGDAWEEMTEAERRAVRPDWQPPVKTPPPPAPVARVEAPPPESRSVNECAACGKDVSPRAQTCPHCGEPQPKPGQMTMIGVLLAICVVSAFIVMNTIGDVGPSPANSSHNLMRVSVSFSPTSMYIENVGSTPLATITVYANGTPPDGYRADVLGPGVGEEIEIPMGAFIDRDGNKMNPFQHSFVKAWVGGGGYDFNLYER